MILIFDTNGGLCNQFYDIANGINFCLKYNIHFTFRYCGLRNDNLITWTEIPIEKLFNLDFLNKYKLYINYYNIKDKLTGRNCYNLNNKVLSFEFLNKNNIYEQLQNLNKKYIVLKQFWSLYQCQNFIDNSIYINLSPSPDIYKIYLETKNKIIGNQPYNFIHYRYEKDFTNYFKIDIESLDNIIKKIKFNNNKIKIFIATTKINNLLNIDDIQYKNLIYNNNKNFNFEQNAFIDYMFGINSVQCFGHSKSSFSRMINELKQSNNYYDNLS